MANLYIDGLNVSQDIKTALHDLSKRIDFTKEDVKGANGYVFFGTNKITKKNVVVKIYYWGGKPEFHAEPQQLATIKSNNVLTIHDAGLTDSKWAYFITPACAKGDIDDLLNTTKIGNHIAVDITYGLLTGLCALHSSRFLHRDIKPSNVYITEEDIPVIGDFGSVKKIPEGKSAIPASSHSLLYRPPESVINNLYGITGDVYQAGMVLYQLLGGYLPYDGKALLSKRDLVHYNSLTDGTDQNAFIDQCIKSKIAAGKILDLSSLPPWVPESLKRLLRRACHTEIDKRIPTASTFMAKLHELKPSLLDWKVLGSDIVLSGKTSYKITTSECVNVQKNTGNGWRSDNSFDGKTVQDLIVQISKKVEA